MSDRSKFLVVYESSENGIEDCHFEETVKDAVKAAGGKTFFVKKGKTLGPGRIFLDVTELLKVDSHLGTLELLGKALQGAGECDIPGCVYDAGFEGWIRNGDDWRPSGMQFVARVCSTHKHLLIGAQQQCDTSGCAAGATEEVSYHDRDEFNRSSGEMKTANCCAECAELLRADEEAGDPL